MHCAICGVALLNPASSTLPGWQLWVVLWETPLNFSIDFTPLVQRLAPLLAELERIEQLAAEPDGKPHPEESDQGIDERS
jgi:hypothetical protein